MISILNQVTFRCAQVQAVQFKLPEFKKVLPLETLLSRQAVVRESRLMPKAH